MKVAVNILKFFMIPAVMLYPLYLNILGGLSFMVQSEISITTEVITSSTALSMKIWACVMFISSALFAAAMVFALCKYNLATLITDILGGVLCFLSTMFMINIHNSSEMEMYIVKPLLDNIMFNHLPTLIPFFMILLIAVVQIITNDTALGPEWKEYKKIRAEHQRMLDERDGVVNKKKEKKKKKENKTKQETTN